MNRIAGAQHPRLRSLDRSIPEAFEHIVGCALAKKPEQRYQRAGEMARELRDFRNLQRRPAPAPVAAAADEVDDTVPLDDPRANQGHGEAVRTQLINDIDKFVEQYDREEQARQRDEFERTRPMSPVAPSPDVTITKTGALDFVRKQAGQPKRQSPSLERAKAIGELDGAMRAAMQYLAGLVRELNSVHPVAERPYEFIYIGKLPKVSVAEAFVDSRPRTLDGHNVIDHVLMRFRITPSQPPKANLLGEDIGRCEQYLKVLKVGFTQRVLAKNDFGKATRAEIAVTGPLPCEINMKADYDASKVAVELTNVRRPGRVVYHLGPRAFTEAVDDLARYMLGADDDFETVARSGK